MEPANNNNNNNNNEAAQRSLTLKRVSI